MSIKPDLLKEYVCTNPFTRLEIFKDRVHCCCPTWNETVVGDPNKLNEVLNSKILKKIQESVIDGSYSYCRKDLCPAILKLVHEGYVDNVFVKKSDTNLDDLRNIEGKLRLKINIDESCTLSCPSCRLSVFMADNELIKEMSVKMNDIVEILGKYTVTLDFTGSGDPFASKVFRDFLINFDETKFPNLKNIELFTNGNLLTKEMWEKMPNIHKYVDNIFISIDAATEETYKILRRRGNWNKLMENIKFLLTVPTIKSMTYIFVVQDTNYKEMDDFVYLMSDFTYIYDYNIVFCRIVNWGTFTDEEFKKKCIWDENHPNFEDFLIEFNKVNNRHKVYTELIDITDKYSLKGIKNLI